MSDHDQSDAPPSQQGQVDPKAAGSAVPGLEDVTIVAWQQNCTKCHGQLGRGDGPQGPMVKATNLSDPAWQSSVTDAQIAAVIKNGKGAMPPLNLPESTIGNLVKLVRMMNAARLTGHGAGSAAPSASAAPVKVAPSASAGVARPVTKAASATAAPAAPAPAATPTPTPAP